MTTKQHTLFVCTACASIWKDGKRVGSSGGEKLLHQIEELAQDWELSDKFQIQAVECMSACSHSCAIAFAGEDKFTYLFGDLPVESSAEAILKCAGQYYAKHDGSLPWSERPEPLKKGILAKIPPLNKWGKLHVTCC
jgi:predicted metal-binding protein